MIWTLDNVLDATGGELLTQVRNSIQNLTFPGISTDSRKAGPGELFIAIKGDIYDGHDFIGNALERGVRGILVSRAKADNILNLFCKNKKKVCIAVSDTLKSLGNLAAFHRKRSDVPLIAITGSNGKTTTRKMTAQIMRQRFRTLSTRGNFNNEIGLPLTLLNLNESHERAVVELGMNRPGEIGRLAEISTPDVGVITNIGPAHLDGVGSLEGVMRAKGELLEKIGPDKTAVLNADDPMTPKLRSLHPGPGRVFLFGFSRNADIRASEVRSRGKGTAFILHLPTKEIPIHLPIPGKFMVSNALAAAAAGYVMGLSPEEIRAGLENFTPVRGRMNIFETREGVHIIDDTYNANPGSMEAALMTLSSLIVASGREKQRGIFVAGDMFELGDDAASLHRETGSAAAKSGIAKLYATGSFAEALASGAREQGMNDRDIFIGNKKELIENLKNYLMPGDWVLIKGSRGMAMEDIVEKIRNWELGNWEIRNWELGIGLKDKAKP